MSDEEDFSDLDAEDDRDLDVAVAADKTVSAKVALVGAILEDAGRVNVNEVAFDQLTGAQLAELGPDRFAAYLDWKDEGHTGAADGIEEPEPERIVPEWATAEGMSDAEFGRVIGDWGNYQDSYGGLIDEKARRTALTGGEE